MRNKRLMWVGAILIGLLCSGSSGAVDAKLLGAIALVLMSAKLVGDIFERLKQPAVLGELLAGIIIGNLTLAGFDGLDFIRTDPQLAMLAEIGVILLLFDVGLESNLIEMARVGVTSFIVAVVGVIFPIGLGYVVHMGFHPDATWHTHLFIGAILAATSVGITARVLKDLGQIDSPTGRVVLGAAVIDDVLGLVVLAVVAGIIGGANTGESLQAWAIIVIVLKAVGFLGAAILLGAPAARAMYKVACYLRVRGVLLAVSLAFCFAMAYGAGAVGLAPIVGAFAAGLVLDAVAYRDLEDLEDHGLEDQLHPLGQFLIPVFFVVTGTKVQLDALGDASILALAGALTAVAIIGKQVCSLVAFGPGINRLAVGLGMIPRGEVGLIFATVGAGLYLDGNPVVDPPTYAAVVVMVMVTTMVTPPLLVMSLGRAEPKAPESTSADDASDPGREDDDGERPDDE